MKTAAFMKRTLELCAPLLFSLAIILSAGNIAQGDASAVPELEAAHNRVQKATMAMKQAEAQKNTRTMEQACNIYNMANQNMAQNLARVAGVRTEDVTGMKRAGMGWEQIAQELGLEPEHLGIDKQRSQTTTPDTLEAQDRTRDRDRDFSQQVSSEPKRTRERERTREFSEATSRNMKNAGATKHGMAMVGSGSEGMGLAKAKRAMFTGISLRSGGSGGITAGGSDGGSGNEGGGCGGSGGGGSGGGP